MSSHWCQKYGQDNFLILAYLHSELKFDQRTTLNILRSFLSTSSGIIPKHHCILKPHCAFRTEFQMLLDLGKYHRHKRIQPHTEQRFHYMDPHYDTNDKDRTDYSYSHYHPNII